ncbi:MAG: hypothetical protein KZQ70_05335 [gamma proteobacterium symbiont of Lucinoma myriamae]|nr:hypothetical protein [gamma proteobacterium symbiont of Lucinoma myriamae]MCU7818485.1 hypothetical protein [gamma proteobacterium symbiont of Lucinoma myriamae]MCU7831992.1 hypothetical protein [gamma proteobacterium symbiont of Lucinoma myriamae]
MSIETNLNNKLESLLNEGRNEMFERKQAILYSIDTQAMEAKKDVRHHITQLVKIRSALSNSTTH